MVKSVAEVQREFVSSHVDQTMFVNELLRDGYLDYSEIEGVEPNEEGEYPKIFQWKLFVNFNESEINRLIEAQIPVLKNCFSSWVGITSFGSPYDLYVYPELINILFGEHADEKYKKTACLEAAV